MQRYIKNVDVGRGLQHSGLYYINFMALLNRELQPRGYFEIGTDTGQSLNCYTCDAVCVDPDFQIASRVWQGRARTFLFQTTSDDFFARERLNDLLPGGPDIAFLDGMHRAEYLLRDFTNLEQVAHPRTLVLIHDCLPLNGRMAARVPRAGSEAEGVYKDAWTGDVWRVLYALKDKRPDLVVRYLDCPPTGLIAISNLDRQSTVLAAEYSGLVRMMMDLELTPDRLRELWTLYPTIDTAALSGEPSDITAVFNCR